MTEVRLLSNSSSKAATTINPQEQYGLFATKSYAEGDVILAESPLAILSNNDDIEVRCQFDAASLVSSNGKKKSTTNSSSSSIINDIILPPSIVEKLNNDTKRTNKLRGMILALASYATTLSYEELSQQSQQHKKNKSKLFQLYHPQHLNVGTCKQTTNQDELNAIELAQLAISCAKQMCASKENALSSLLLKSNDDDELLVELLLIYTCNSFEGGRVYNELSRVNHSCDPNAVVVEGSIDDFSTSAASTSNEGTKNNNNNDMSVLKAACDIKPGDEITISYLGKYLFASYPIRQKVLRANKHFVCKCVRCSKEDCGSSMSNVNEKKKSNESDAANYQLDLASRIPCPVCHPRTGRYLDEDVMFDDDDDEDYNDTDEHQHGFKVCYAIPINGITPEERSVYCPTCKSTTTVVSDDGASMRKKKEGLAIKYMCMAEEKVFNHLEGGYDATKQDRSNVSSVDDSIDTEREINQQYLQMATSICGAKHWTTHFINLSLIEESLASFHSTLMSMGQQDASSKDATETMEELFVDIAECTDGIEKAYRYASSLELKINPAHWLFDYTVGLARTLVGLGDVKSQKYGSTWIAKVERYAHLFENDGMNKVVVALRDAWKREEVGGGGGAMKAEETGKTEEESEGQGDDYKRRKLG